MSKRNRQDRPNAFETSFPGEGPTGPSTDLRDNASLSKTQDSDRVVQRRDKDISSESRSSGQPGTKRQRIEQRRHVAPTQKPAYAPTEKDYMEQEGMVIFGEDAEERLDAEDPDTDKPVRCLHDYVLFDPDNNLQLVPLDSLHRTIDGRACRLEAAGFVSPAYVNEEDEGQEDGIDDNAVSRMQRLRTTTIFNYSVDYKKFDDPLYIETTHAWYILCSPSPTYQHIHADFYRAHRIAQIVIAAATSEGVSDFVDFERRYLGVWDPLLGEHVQYEDLHNAVPLIANLLEENSEEYRAARSRPFVRHILTLGRRQVSQLGQSMTVISPTFSRLKKHPIKLRGYGLNLDLAVLRPENQISTHVTPLIDKLSWGLFRERLHVVGTPLKRTGEHVFKQQQSKIRAHLIDLLTRGVGRTRHVSFPSNQRLQDEYWKTVIVDGDTYQIGDCILVNAGEWNGQPPPPIPHDLDEIRGNAGLADYLWFGKILYINQRSKMLHVQWFTHSTKTYLGCISNSQELFLCPLCGDVDLQNLEVFSKVRVYHPRPPGELGSLEFFYEYLYNETDGSFTDVDETPVADYLSPPENCPVCLRSIQQRHEMSPQLVEGGISYLGETYHVNDYALVHGEDSPARIGRIVSINAKRDGLTVSIALLGRMVDILSKSGGYSSFADERELFMTNEQDVVPPEDLIKKCIVLHHKSMPNGEHDWLSASPLHFFVKQYIPSLSSSLDMFSFILPSNVHVCQSCYQEDKAKFRDLERFSRRPESCLRAFDPFAGVGAFGLSMERARCLQVTHAVEISPSAADTLRKNSPHTIVYNQCSNIVLKYAVRSHAGLLVEESDRKDIEGKKRLHLPPTPGQIDCIIAGFPCQPHSALNMWQKAHDRKSHLILNLLSWVEFLQPKYCFFENVHGFLRYNLHASQASRHTVEGGIDKGGLKFLVHALLVMNYQVRFALLQAGHYGTPQRRIRFFLIASKKTYPLPSFPQPTHDSIFNEELPLNLAEGVTIKPILTARGTAPFKHVSVLDAIGDLLPFDWQDPDTRKGSSRLKVAVKCDSADARSCGPEVAAVRNIYTSEPRNSYQKQCRAIDPTVEGIQHFTRTFKPQVVKRVLGIPVKPRADYRDLSGELWQWQISNPASATARLGFIPGFYGRLDKDGWFHTTVTNVQPMAKQSHVIHYQDRRILSVRELARSQGFPDCFVFLARDNCVRTMHRQIGNAVPWQVGEALGRELLEAMFKRWQKAREDAIVVSDTE